MKRNEKPLFATSFDYPDSVSGDPAAPIEPVTTAPQRRVQLRVQTKRRAGRQLPIRDRAGKPSQSN